MTWILIEQLMTRHKLSRFCSVLLNSMFPVHSGKIFMVGAAGSSLQETHLSDAAGMWVLHGLNCKRPKTHNSLGNQDVRQLPLGQGLCGQRIKLHPYYPLVWMKGFLVRMKRFMSWNEKLKPPLNGQDHNNVVNRVGLTLT